MTASDKILQKALVGSNLDSSQWSMVHAGLRDRAFFSAQVQNVRTLSALRQKLAERAAGRLSESEIRRDMRQILAATGYQAPGNGIQDLATKRRLDLVMQTNVQQARGYIQYLEGTQPGALLAFPAQELVRVRQRSMPRNWLARWRKAGGRIIDGNRMVALKTDPIWTAISAFGTPFPPFDFNSGMGLRDIDREEAIKLGIITKDEKPKAPSTPSFNQNLYATVPEIRNDSPEAQMLRDAFGDQVDFRGNEVHWRGELIKEVFNGTRKNMSLGVGYDGTKTSISRALIDNHVVKHIGDNEKRGDSIPLSVADFELLPTLWRTPSRVVDGHGVGRKIVQLDLLDGGTLCLVRDMKTGPKTVYKMKKSPGAA